MSELPSNTAWAGEYLRRGLQIQAQELALQAAHKGIRRLKERQKALVKYFHEAEKYKTLAATYKRKLDLIADNDCVEFLATVVHLKQQIDTQKVAIQDLKRKLGYNVLQDGASET